MNIDSAQIKKILLALLAEAYDGPENPRMTWFVDNEPACGLLGTLEKLSAAEAGKPLDKVTGMSIASHAGHLRFSLNLANRALRGEDVHSTANWKDSWGYRTVDEPAWKDLLAGLRTEYANFRAAVASDLIWGNEMNLTGTFGQLAHGAWHLGAIRQALGLVRL